MRTAICFSGFPQIQHVKENLSNTFKILFPQYDSFWYLPCSAEYYDMIYYLHAVRIVVKEDLPMVNAQKFPKQHKLKTGVESFLQQIYSWQQVNILRKRHEVETGTKYDLVVRCRPDLYFTNVKKVDFDIDKITVPFFASNNGYNDRFSVGSGESMDVLCNFYDFLYEHPEVIKEVNAEAAFKLYLDAMGMQVFRDRRLVFGRMRSQPPGHIIYG